MEEAANLDVQLKAEASSGSSWYDAKQYKINVNLHNVLYIINKGE